ncbi:MFS transporter [Pelatocladus sp. BLCC-F211]|uniref:MFS transporter n=1 Tax=Pelatocladus sp. BLCC-F211 TaxID=3342752 RepID=UPI0035B8521A
MFSSTHKIYLLKLLLCSNIYLIIFFQLLLDNGLSSNEIVNAISFGTICMLVGDILSSLFADSFGPKKIILTAALVQALSVYLLPKCSSFEQLLAIEFLIGISFPTIYGSDSKWLKHICSKDKYSEKKNQSVFWLSQFASALIGCLLLGYPIIACYLSMCLYLIGFFICLQLPDVPSNLATNYLFNFKLIVEWIFKENKIKSILFYGSIMGILNSYSWLLQYYVTKDYAKVPIVFAIIQVIGAGLSLTGSLLSKKQINRGYLLHMVYGVMGFYLYYTFSSTVFALWLSIGLGLLLRGMLSVVARNSLLSNYHAQQPIASLIFTLTGTARIVQAITLYIISFLALHN